MIQILINQLTKFSLLYHNYADYGCPYTILTIGKYTNNTLGTFPIQKFAYYDENLSIRETAPCITPQRVDNCTASDKWTYDPHSKILKWENKGITVKEKQPTRYKSYITCPSLNNAIKQ